MGLLRLSPELNRQRKISLEITFLTDYMPVAPENYTKVYLLGLSLAGSEDSDFESIAIILNLDIAAVTEAFSYWKQQGIVNMTESPLSVEYLPVIPYSRQIKKFSKEKYKTFNDQLHVLIKDRNILPNEYHEYYSVMESYHIEIEAMLTIIGYCIRLKGTSVGYPYILAVAKNLAAIGCTSYDRVQEKLSEYDLYDKDLKAVIKSVGLKRHADHTDRTMFLKWKNEYGFNLETIIQVAKQVKKGGMERLDMLLGRYYENHLFSIEEIDAFNENRTHLYDLTKKYIKILGLYYEQLDHIIETYTLKFLQMGFTDDAILLIADYCFKKGMKSLELLNDAATKFYKQGLVTVESINGFINELVSYDDEIKEIFAELNFNRIVTTQDRDFYKTWTKNWQLSRDVIMYAASLSKFKASSLAYMNSILASYFSNGIKTVEDAKKSSTSFSADTQSKPKAASDNIVNRNISAEELNAMFDKLSDDEI